MDGSRFDAWTRRRVGLVGGGLFAALVGVTPLAETVAKKKRKKKRCRKVRQGCKTGGKRKRCCKRLRCAETTGLTGKHCCRDGGEPCAGSDCCVPFACFGGACELI